MKTTRPVVRIKDRETHYIAIQDAQEICAQVLAHLGPTLTRELTDLIETAETLIGVIDDNDVWEEET